MTGPAERRSDHYSYSAYASERMAETFEASRFGGPIGRMLAETQERVIAGFLQPLGGASVLDVGTGAGRAAIALARRGATVTAVDASAEMLGAAERRAREANVRIAFARGDAHQLEFPDRAFDHVVSLRVLMHTPAWRRALAELCRVARSRVVLDYPALLSAAALQAAGRRVARRLGADVEAYRVFSDAAFRRELRSHGFHVAGAHRQFVLPIALHKLFGSARMTTRVEGALAGAGVTRLCGSPVTLVAHRTGSPAEAARR
jgi:SAM-dependent methyltransferase